MALQNERLFGQPNTPTLRNRFAGIENALPTKLFNPIFGCDLIISDSHVHGNDDSGLNGTNERNKDRTRAVVDF